MRRRLVGRRWIHAHEEDEGPVAVYRPEGTPLPPSRGRESFELRDDGSCTVEGIGPSDGTLPAEAAWELRGGDGDVVLVLEPGTAGERHLRVKECGASRLAMQPETGA